MPPNTSHLDNPAPTTRALEGPLLRPEQAAALLAVKTSWVYEAVPTGRHIRLTRSDA